MNNYHTPSYLQPIENLLHKQYNHFWPPAKASTLTNDISDWNELPVSVQKRIKMVLSTFTNVEHEIIDTLDDVQSILKTSLPPWVLEELYIVFVTLQFQQAMEGIHLQSYITIDDALRCDHSTNTPIFSHAKTNVMKKYRACPDDPLSVSKAIIATIFTEGIIFVNFFVLFFYLKKKSLLSKTVTINEEVLFDEGLHTTTFITLYNILTDQQIIPRLSQSQVYSILDDFVQIEDVCCNHLLGNMSQDDKKFFTIYNEPNARLYTRITANHILYSLHYEPYYACTPSQNPFGFVNVSILKTLTSFFDNQVVEYGIDVDNDYQNESDPE